MAYDVGGKAKSLVDKLYGLVAKTVAEYKFGWRTKAVGGGNITAEEIKDISGKMTGNTSYLDENTVPTVPDSLFVSVAESVPTSPKRPVRLNPVPVWAGPMAGMSGLVEGPGQVRRLEADMYAR